MTVEFFVRTEIAAPAERVFDLALDVDAHLASFEHSGERAVGGVTSGVMTMGDEVTWKARHFGIPFTMTSRITAYDRPHHFVDEQVRGPFKRFHHDHEFEPHGETTSMIDRVTFDAPLGPLGRLVERLMLGTYLQRLIEDRAAFLKQQAEAS